MDIWTELGVNRRTFSKESVGYRTRTCLVWVRVKYPECE